VVWYSVCEIKIKTSHSIDDALAFLSLSNFQMSLLYFLDVCWGFESLYFAEHVIDSLIVVPKLKWWLSLLVYFLLIKYVELENIQRKEAYLAHSFGGRVTETGWPHWFGRCQDPQVDGITVPGMQKAHMTRQETREFQSQACSFL
jgi:hypothetical protein